MAFYDNASEFEVIDAVGILLDNAIESSHQNDTIYITIASKETAKKNHGSITVSNTSHDDDKQYISFELII